MHNSVLSHVYEMRLWPDGIYSHNPHPAAASTKIGIRSSTCTKSSSWVNSRGRHRLEKEGEGDLKKEGRPPFAWVRALGGERKRGGDWINIS